MLCAVDIITWNLHEDARRVSVTQLVLCLQAVIYKPDSVNVNQVCLNVKVKSSGPLVGYTAGGYP